MPTISPYISKEQIDERIEYLGRKINEDYKGEEVVIVGILNGSFLFCADLVRKMSVSTRVEFLSASSYGNNKESSGDVKINMDLRNSIEGKHIIVVEDIVDTGLTLKTLLEIFKMRGPKSIRIASLLFKSSRLIHPVDIDYLGFEIEDRFVVGYGLDYGGKYRELPYIGIYQD